MEGLRSRGVGWQAVVVVLTCTALLMITDVSSVRIQVGSDMGWTTNVNYTQWAQGKHFYNGDWLYFIYDRNQFNILEVNQTDYETCNSATPMHNWSTGHGRDVVPLNETRDYYFISGNGYCYGGMKLAIDVENSPPPPVASPPAKSGTSRFTLTGHVVIPAAIVVAAVWDSFF